MASVFRSTVRGTLLSVVLAGGLFGLLPPSPSAAQVEKAFCGWTIDRGDDTLTIRVDKTYDITFDTSWIAADVIDNATRDVLFVRAQPEGATLRATSIQAGCPGGGKAKKKGPDDTQGPEEEEDECE